MFSRKKSLKYANISHMNTFPRPPLRHRAKGCVQFSLWDQRKQKYDVMKYCASFGGNIFTDFKYLPTWFAHWICLGYFWVFSAIKQHFTYIFCNNMASKSVQSSTKSPTSSMDAVNQQKTQEEMMDNCEARWRDIQDVRFWNIKDC
jgi:hypothetical protein